MVRGWKAGVLAASFFSGTQVVQADDTRIEPSCAASVQEVFRKFSGEMTGSGKPLEDLVVQFQRYAENPERYPLASFLPPRQVSRAVFLKDVFKKAVGEEFFLVYGLVDFGDPLRTLQNVQDHPEIFEAACRADPGIRITAAKLKS